MTCGWLWCLLVGLPFPCLVDVVLLCLFSFDFVFTFVDYLTCWKFVCMVNCLLLIGVNLICLYVFWLVCLQVWLWFGFLVSFVGVCCFCWIVFLVCWTWRLDFAFVCLWVLGRFLFLFWIGVFVWVLNLMFVVCLGYFIWLACCLLCDVSWLCVMGLFYWLLFWWLLLYVGLWLYLTWIFVLCWLLFVV